ncbi:MAG: toll/interleukin-1 receptor domain-containing protein, partial [Pseudomonadota bacterium]
MDGHAVADPTETTDTGDKLRVFVSYSRAQVHFADEVVLSLEDKGHAPLIDRHTIAKGEDFKPRLGELILKADTVVFILSDESAKSDVCAWEVEEAARLAKRILVVTLGDLSPRITPPEKLAGIDWIHCWANPAVPGSSQTRGFIELDQALRTDIGWLRKQTELQEQAAKWDARGRESDDPVLLREDLLAEGLDWSRSAPTGQAVPALVAAFLKASDQAEATRKAEAAANLDAREKAVAAARRASGRLRTVGLIGAGVATVFLCAALVLGWYAALGARDVARQSSNILATEARTIYDGGNVDVALSLLMALQADPAAVRDPIGRRLDHKTGYAFARARMEAGHINNPLGQVFTGHDRGVNAVAVAPGGRLVTGSS